MNPAHPSLLFACPVLPRPRGLHAQTRAWQLLQAAAQTHHVTLLAIPNHPVSLVDWRRLEPLTQRILLLPNVEARRKRPLAPRLRNALPSLAFDALLAGPADLLSRLHDVDAPRRLCDPALGRPNRRSLLAALRGQSPAPDDHALLTNDLDALIQALQPTDANTPGAPLPALRFAA